VLDDAGRRLFNELPFRRGRPTYVAFDLRTRSSIGTTRSVAGAGKQITDLCGSRSATVRDSVQKWCKAFGVYSRSRREAPGADRTPNRLSLTNRWTSWDFRRSSFNEPR
jgi:hypothetical protein